MDTEPLNSAKEQQEIAEARLATLEANLKRQALETTKLQEGAPRFATGDPRVWWNVPSGGYGDAPTSQQHWAKVSYESAVDNRENERFQPFYLDESDLRRKRAEWRNIAAFSSIAIGASEARKNYVLGNGFTFEVTPDGEESDELASKVQTIVDQFVEDNDFQGVLDAELFDRTSEDGEAFVALYPFDGWRSYARIIEPDQITEPLDPSPIEQWRGFSGVNYWWHGIHTQAIQLGSNAWVDNTARPLGYHVVFDTMGDYWDYLPESRCQHIKKNTPVNARRGVSDFMAVLYDLELEGKLRKNTGEGAAIQAAIAYIREHAPGTTQSSIEAFAQGGRTGTYDKQTSDGTRETNTRQFNSGTILDVGQTKYHAGPLGSIQSPIFIEVAGYILRSIGVRWSMPEYIISSDASNANFASTLVSESPFVKAREREQEFFSRHFRKLVWKAVRIAWEAGRLPEVAWHEVKKAVSIEVETPDVATRDRLENAQEKKLLSEAGIISKRTWSAEADYDYDEEQKRIAEEKPATPPPMPGMVPGQQPPQLQQAQQQQPLQLQNQQQQVQQAQQPIAQTTSAKKTKVEGFGLPESYDPSQPRDGDGKWTDTVGGRRKAKSAFIEKLIAAGENPDAAKNIYGRLYHRLQGGEWKTSNDLTAKFRDGTKNISGTSRRIKKLRDMGVAQVAWDSEGWPHYAIQDAELPDWLTQSDDDAALLALPPNPTKAVPKPAPSPKQHKPRPKVLSKKVKWRGGILGTATERGFEVELDSAGKITNVDQFRTDKSRESAPRVGDNYREWLKRVGGKSSTVRGSKVYESTLQEHLPGEHDQKTHGRKHTAPDYGGSYGGGRAKKTKQGEYWLQMGHAEYADGDIGDFTHEGLAMDAAQREVIDSVTDEIDDVYEYTDGEVLDWEGFESALEASVGDIDEWAKGSGVDPETLAIAQGYGDPRLWAADKLGWIRLQDNNVQMVGVSNSKLKELADGLYDAYDESVESESFDIEVVTPESAKAGETVKSTTYYDVPYLAIDAGRVAGLRDFKESHLQEHQGPGPHDSGSSQDVHGKKGGSVKELRDSLRERYDLEELWISDRRGDIHLDNIRVREGNRGQGVGGAVLEEIKEYAQKIGKPITLGIEADPGKKKALARFYERHGFVRPGGSKDYSLTQHSHVWYPDIRESYDPNLREGYPEFDPGQKRSEDGKWGSGGGKTNTSDDGGMEKHIADRAQELRARNKALGAERNKRQDERDALQMKILDHEKERDEARVAWRTASEARDAIDAMPINGTGPNSLVADEKVAEQLSAARQEFAEDAVKASTAELTAGNKIAELLKQDTVIRDELSRIGSERERGVSEFRVIEPLSEDSGKAIGSLGHNLVLDGGNQSLHEHFRKETAEFTDRDSGGYVVDVKVDPEGAVSASRIHRGQLKDRITKGLGAQLNGMIRDGQLSDPQVSDALADLKAVHYFGGQFKDTPGFNKQRDQFKQDNDQLPGAVNAVEVSEEIVNTWASSSTDGNALSLAVQASVKRKFSDKGVVRGATEQSLHDGAGLYRKHSEVIDAVVGVMYDDTQAKLKAAGVEKVTLFRGMRLDSKNHEVKGGDVKIDMNPISSFAMNYDTAKQFARPREGSYSAVAMVEVPRERIFSTAATGMGCLTESEVLVTGETKIEGKIVIVDDSVPDTLRGYLKKLHRMENKSGD